MVRIFFVIVLLSAATSLYAQNNFLLTKYADISELKQQLAAAAEGSQKDTILQNLIDLYVWYKPDSALYFTQQKILLSKELKAPHMEAYSTGYYGYILGILGNYPQALNYLLKGLRMAEGLKQEQRLDFFYDALSDTYTEQGNYNLALFYANRFEQVSIHKRDTLLYGWLISKGVAYEKFNRLDSAMFYLQKAYDFEMRTWGEIRRGRTLLTLGNIHFKKGNISLARHFYQIAIDNAFRHGHFVNLIEACNGMARLYATDGQLDSGAYYANEALHLSQFTTYSLGKLNTYSILSALFNEQGNMDSTVKYLKATIVLKDSLFNQLKEREVQTLSFNEQLRQQETIVAQQQFRNRIKMYALATGLVLLLIIAALLYHNNRTKQRSVNLLQKQKSETEQQKAKTEEALHDLRATQAQLVQREKMASLGELTAGIAHEIQNPLNFVNNFSEVNKELLTEAKLELSQGHYDDVAAILADIEQNEAKISHHGKRADNIVKGMLQHSRHSEGAREPTSINQLVEEYLQLAYRGFKAKDPSFHTSIKTCYSEQAVTLNIVPHDVGRVLLNLFNNAFYAVQEKKKQLNGALIPTVSVSTERAGNEVVITVGDNGMGISRVNKEKVFQPFFTTKPTGEGTGLGLSLSYDIITKGHGGELKVESKEGEGSQFVIRLPV